MDQSNKQEERLKIHRVEARLRKEAKIKQLQDELVEDLKLESENDLNSQVSEDQGINAIQQDSLANSPEITVSDDEKTQNSGMTFSELDENSSAVLDGEDWTEVDSGKRKTKNIDRDDKSSSFLKNWTGFTKKKSKDLEISELMSKTGKRPIFEGSNLKNIQTIMNSKVNYPSNIYNDESKTKPKVKNIEFYGNDNRLESTGNAPFASHPQYQFPQHNMMLMAPPPSQPTWDGADWKSWLDFTLKYTEYYNNYGLYIQMKRPSPGA